VYIAGHRGLVGSAVWRRLSADGFTNLVGHPSSEVDLRDRDATFDAILTAKPDVVVMAAARVGGIMANSTHPVDFLNDNLRIQTNIFEAAHEANVERFIFLGSSCIYPKMAEQPIREDSLLTGPLEPTNDAYAIAKIAGVLAVKSYRHQYGRRWISAMPTNLYGPGDNFDLTSSHVLPAMIRKFHEAKESGNSVTLWGSGTPRREFLHTDDVASAILHLLDHYDSETTINIGCGEDVTIRELAAMVAEVVGFDGEVIWDSSKPDGTPRKLLDVSRIYELGWRPEISLRAGIASTYEWFLANHVPLTG
jgi:GDP-L-fucose synthase